MTHTPTSTAKTHVCAQPPLVRSTVAAGLMAIVETTQSRSAKIPTLGVLLSLVAASFRSLFSGLGLVGA